MAKNPNPKLSKAAQKRRKEVDRARDRYKRQAERFKREAKTLGGRDAQILEQSAQRMLERSEALKGINVRKPLDADTKYLVKDSQNFLVSNMRDSWQRGDTIGKLRMSGTPLGHRFFALTQEYWQGVPYTGPGDDRRLNAVRDAFAEWVASNKEFAAAHGWSVHPNAAELIDMAEYFSQSYLDTGGDWAICDSENESFQQLMITFTRNYG